MAAKRKTARTAAKGSRRARSPARRKTGAGARARPRRWSQRVTEESDALDLRHGVFAQSDPKKIAASLKRSAERSHRRKSAPYRSAMSMLTFYINRGGRGLSAARKRKLERAKDELRKLFHKD
ncbi:MAG: DUF3175 domain-containing protein [Pseudorhodoplanes sp.]